METIFTEKQRPRQLWIWAVVILINLLTLYAIVQQVILKKPFGNNPGPDYMLFIIEVIPLLLLWLFLSLQLHTRIDKEGVHIKFPPLLRHERTYSWNDIEKCYVRKYSPVKEFGGWGIRGAMSRGAGRAFNVSGKYGIQLELKNGDKVLIGTQRQEEAEKIVEGFGKQSHGNG